MSQKRSVYPGCDCSHGESNGQGSHTLSIGEQINDNAGNVFNVKKKLGNGGFSDVYLVTYINTEGQEECYAVKIAKNNEAAQSAIYFECNVLNFLCENSQTLSLNHLSYYRSAFKFHDTYCILMDFIGPSIYDVIGDNESVGLPLVQVQQMLRCILSTLESLSDLQVMHSDVKAENILQSKTDKSKFKLIDYHCAAICGRPNPTYVQTRYVRSPEVLLHLKYDCKIDIWSLALTAFEMFLGSPLFPCTSETHMLYEINRFFGPFPQQMVSKSPRGATFFLQGCEMKSAERLCQENMLDVRQWKQHYDFDTIDEIIISYNPKSEELSESELNNRRLFIEFLYECLRINPEERISASDALKHPFIINELSQ